MHPSSTPPQVGELDSSELPGMWEQADLTGGATDCTRPATKDPASLPAPAESRQGGCTTSWLEKLTARPFLGGLVAAAVLLWIGFWLSFIVSLVMELAQ